MNKSILKYFGGLALCSITPISGLVGMCMAFSNFPTKIEKQKEEILDKYRLTQEFIEEKEEKEDLYLQAYTNGMYSLAEYTEKVEELNSTSFAENLILTNNNQEFKPLIEEKNKLIEQKESKQGIGIGVMIGGGFGGMLPFAAGCYWVAEERKNAQKAISDYKYKKSLAKSKKEKDYLEVDL